MGKFTVEVRQLVNVSGDYRWKRVGQIDSYLSLDVIIRYNDIGSWTLVIPADSVQASLIQPGMGVIITYEGLYNPIMSGPVRVIKSSWDSSTNSYPGTIEFSGPDDNTLMEEHLCLPDPTVALVNGQFNSSFGPYTINMAADTYVTVTNDPANPNKLAPYSMERLIRRLVYYNFGDGSTANRAVKGCSFVPPANWPAAGTYPLTTYDLRNVSVLEAVKTRAEVGTMSDGTTRPIGYRWVWDPATEKIGMVIYYPNNTPALGKGVRFSRENGNLTSYNYTLAAPKSTWMLFGLDTETANKPETQHLYIADKRSDPDVVDWNMSAESYKDSSSVSLYKLDANNKPIVNAQGKKTVDTDSINTAVAAEWLNDAPLGGLTVTPIDTQGCRFGIHYWLGDLVTVVENDVETTSVLREVHLSDDSNGPVIQSTIGDSTATETPALYKEIRKIWRALKKTQQTKTGVIYG
jgi:hypothetical protein